MSLNNVFLSLLYFLISSFSFIYSQSVENENTIKSENNRRFDLNGDFYIRNLANGEFLGTRENNIVNLQSEREGSSTVWTLKETPNGSIVLLNKLEERGPLQVPNTVGEEVNWSDKVTIDLKDHIEWMPLYVEDNFFQFVDKNNEANVMTASNKEVIVLENKSKKESKWELIPATEFTFDEVYHLKNVKTGQYLNAGKDLSLKQKTSVEGSSSEWKIKPSVDGFFIIDNIDSDVGPISARPMHSTMRVLEERYNDFKFKNREWHIIHVRDSIYKFFSKDFNRGFMTVSEWGTIRNLPDASNPAAQWELVKKTLPIIDNTDTEITIYPNPTQGEFKINFGKRIIARLVIFSITGRVVYDRSITNDQKEATVTKSLRSGVYMVQLVDQQGEATTRRLVRL